jgi:hypothetical protein
VVRVRARDPSEDELGAAVRDALAQVQAYLRRSLVDWVGFVAFVIAPLALLVFLVVGLPLLLILR